PAVRDFELDVPRVFPGVRADRDLNTASIGGGEKQSRGSETDRDKRYYRKRARHFAINMVNVAMVDRACVFDVGGADSQLEPRLEHGRVLRIADLAWIGD